jgi:pimeloyl-ACP methyl ester carboxylesterase
LEEISFMADRTATLPAQPAWLPQPAFPFQSRFVEIEAKRVHYVDEGAGPALLLVSAGQWSFMFRDVILRLRHQFRCLTLDFPGSGLSPDADDHDQSVRANAGVLDGFIEALDLQDITMVVHGAGGPVGFLIATMRPERFRALVISNSFGWPLREYPSVRRMLKVIGNPLVSALNTNTNAFARFTARSYGVGRHLTRADRRAFLGPWRSRAARHATQQVLAGLLRIDPLMSELELELRTKLADIPVLTLFGCKNDRLGWQRRFGLMFRNVTSVRIQDGHHFPFNDDPDRYAAAIGDWWATRVAEAHRQF